MEKYRWATSSSQLIALALCLALPVAASAQSNVPGPPRAATAVPASSGEVIRFVIRAGEKTVEFDVDAPVKGLFYFDMDRKTGATIEVKIFGRNGDLLGTGGARLAQPGKVRVRMIRRDRRKIMMDKALPVEGRFILVENDPDRFEPNDKPGKARVLKLGPDNPIAGGPAMLFPEGDVDWFRLQITAPGLITPYILKPVDSRFEVNMMNAKGRYITLGRAIRVEPGMLAFKIVGGPSGFDLIEVGFAYTPIWDDCESNMRAGNACVLQFGKPVYITLFSSPVFTGGTQRSTEKWYALTAPEPGYIILSLSGLPKPKYNSKNVQTAGLKLRATVLFSEGGRSKNLAVHVSHGSLIFRAEEPGNYKIGLSGTWLRADSLRVIKLTPLFRRHIATSLQDANLVILGMAPNDRRGRIALGLALLAGAGGGYYANALTPKKITSVIKKFLGGGEPKPAGEQPQPVLTPEQLELARLIGLRAYLAAEKGNFLFRHHFRAKSGEVLKRLEKTKKPGQPRASQVHIKTEKLSPVISRRLLDRDIQNLE